jgi:TonB family protein
MVAAALACAAPLVAQSVPHGPQLMRVVASSGGVVLSIDSSTVARSGDSTFVADAVFQFPADTGQRVAADRQVDSQEMDCAGMRLRGRRTAYYLGDSPVPVPAADTAAFSTRWEPVNDDELPIIQALCQVLLGSFASLPVTREVWSVDDAPELANRGDVARELSRQYPPAARAAGEGGHTMLRFQITAQGRVDMATARAVWATRDDFAAAAFRVVEAMRFRPAKEGGQPVPVWVTLPVTFWITGDGMQGPPGPDRGPTGSPLWGGRSSQPTRPPASQPFARGARLMGAIPRPPSPSPRQRPGADDRPRAETPARCGRR